MRSDKVVDTQATRSNPVRAQLLRQAVETETQMASAPIQVDELKRFIAMEEKRLGTWPQKELGLAWVTRDFDVPQQTCLLLRPKYEEMCIAGQMKTSDMWRAGAKAIATSPVTYRKVLSALSPKCRVCLWDWERRLSWLPRPGTESVRG